MRVAVEARRLAAELGLDRHARLLQRGLGAVRASGRTTCSTPTSGCRTHLDHLETDVLVPHADPRLPLGRAAGRRHRRRRHQRLDSAERGRRRRAARRRRCHGPGDRPAPRRRRIAAHGDGVRSRASRPSCAGQRRFEPLLAFASHPRRAPDLVDPVLGPALERARKGHTAERVGGWRRELRIAAEHWRQGGFGQVFRRAAARLRRLAQPNSTTRGSDV